MARSAIRCLAAAPSRDCCAGAGQEPIDRVRHTHAVEFRDEQRRVVSQHFVDAISILEGNDRQSGLHRLEQDGGKGRFVRREHEGVCRRAQERRRARSTLHEVEPLHTRVRLLRIAVEPDEVALPATRRGQLDEDLEGCTARHAATAEHERHRPEQTQLLRHFEACKLALVEERVRPRDRLWPNGCGVW